MTTALQLRHVERHRYQPRQAVKAAEECQAAIHYQAPPQDRHAPSKAQGAADQLPIAHSSLSKFVPSSLEGASFAKALAQLGIQERTGYRWVSAHPDFRQDLTRAREIRGDFSFGEQILDIADNSADDWFYNEKTGKPSVNKEAIPRSKLRIKARQFHMSRLHPQTWGERQTIDLKSDWSLLTLEERERKARELIGMIAEMKQPPPAPPALEYRWQEPDEDDDQQQRGIGCQPRQVVGR
jgi:hypothetical protein